MVCNSELDELRALVSSLPSLLSQNARVVIVAYHSLEDRIIKQAFADGARSGIYERVTRRVVRPSSEEIASNPRSRSARLRCVRRVEDIRR